MTTITHTARPATIAPATTRTRSLLTCAAIAAPLWTTIALSQAATRENFDLTRHPISMLANGDLGWLQIGNFILAGILTIAGSFGLARAMNGTPGGTWAPRTARLTGLGLVGAGIFVMDPADGFPSGTPAGTPSTFSAEMTAHLVSSSIAFLAIIATCYLFGRHYARTGHLALANASRIAGTTLLAGNGWAMSGGQAGSLTLAIGYITATVWIAYAAYRFRSHH